jgi:hypothetical protein
MPYRPTSRTIGTSVTRQTAAVSQFDSPYFLAESMILLVFRQQGDSHVGRDL